MAFQDLPIKRKVVAVVMSTTIIALLLAITAFVIHDLVNFRQNLIRSVSTTAAIVAEESSSSLAFQSEKDAQQVLAALHADPRIIRAAIYDASGNVYASYPAGAPITNFPLKPGPPGPRLEQRQLIVYAPINEGQKNFGTLYLVSDLRAISERIRLFSIISVMVLLGALLAALAISNKLQRSITAPVLALAGTARMVSERGDYSVRARQVSGDEFGLLTDAFNLMLGRIQEQTVALRERELQLRLAMEASRIGTFDYHIRTQRIILDHYFRSLLGIPEGSTQDRFEDFLALIQPEDREPVAQALRTAIETRSEFNAEYRVMGSDQQIRYITSRGRASYDESGNAIRVNGVALDITGRKKAEETQSVLAAIVESSDDAIVGKDLSGHILSWNRGAQKMLGYTPSEMIGKRIDEIIPAEFLASENEAASQIRTGIARHFESARLRKDGTQVNVSVALSPITNAVNNVIGIASIVRDITEAIRGQDAQRRLAAIVESSDDAIISADLRGIITSWNQGAMRLYGYAAQEAIGQPLTMLQPTGRPQQDLSILERLARGERIDRFETQRQRKDGTLVDVSLTVSPLKNEQGVIIGVSKFARDITEVKQAQAALERQANILREQAQMLDLANVLARDLEDRIILWNSGMEKLYGWSKVEALGKVSHELFRTIFPQPHARLREHLLTAGHWEGELIHFRKDGSRINVSSQWVVHHDNSGTAAAILEVNTDITARKKAEAEITRINAELEERVEVRTAELTAANKELEAFTYSVAHDLRAPLRHIDAFSRILHEDFASILPPEAQHYLHNIRHGSRNMSQLVDDLLNLARVGRQELKRQPTLLSSLVEDVILDLKTETEKRKIEWQVGPLPTVECDAGLMKQVFANLLSNAVKYTRPREVAVIQIGSSEIKGEKVIFIRDNGVGFSMKYADKLFGVFQRLHRAEDFEGTGVGLATVERIVRKHGGTIWAEAAVEKGATFYFTISSLNPTTV